MPSILQKALYPEITIMIMFTAQKFKIWGFWLVFNLNHRIRDKWVFLFFKCWIISQNWVCIQHCLWHFFLGRWKFYYLGLTLLFQLLILLDWNVVWKDRMCASIKVLINTIKLEPSQTTLMYFKFLFIKADFAIIYYLI